MNRGELAVLLDRIGPHLDALVEPWAVIGSAALIIAGVAWPDCADVDILTTETGAEILERFWADWRQGHYAPDPNGPFRSRFSRYDFAPGAVEVMGGLKVRKGAAWRAVTVGAPVRTSFGAHRWSTPSLEEQVRILKLFGRDKDLEKVRRIRLMD